MINSARFSIADYLNKSFSCNCGKNHITAIEDIDISKEAIFHIPHYLEKNGYKRVFLVSDQNTHAVAGTKVCEILKQSGVDVVDFIFRAQQVVPDENAIGELVMAFDPSCQVMIAIGTGTINDICKYLSYKFHKPYFIVATAPSMDGFASTGAALITNNVKTTYTTHSPQVIIADIDILSQAPMEMITAGLGDILGKYTCLCDWKMANLINGEYYCERIVDMVKMSIEKVVGNFGAVKTRSPQVIYNITEALMLTGIAMSFVGNSRPASGSEHHISHYWEMKFLLEGKKPVLHGTKVGVGTVAVLKLYEMLKDTKVDFEEARIKAKSFDFAKWEQNIHRTFGVAAEGIIELEKSVGKNSREGRIRRIAAIEQNWHEMICVIEQTLPSAQEVETILSELSAPINPGQEGIDFGTIVDSIIVAKEVRDRYTLLQMLWDLGIAESMAQRIASYFKDDQDVGAVKVH